MEVTEETKKRIGLIVGIIIVIGGAMFMIFAFFLNKGTLIVTAKAPYLISIEGVKSVACQTEICPVTVAPGRYEITVKKESYRDVPRLVSVPIGGEAKEEIAFQLIPTITLLGDEKALNLFATPTIQKEEIPQAPLFYDNNYVLYIERDTTTHRQTLYVRSIENGKLGEKTVVTSFIRDLKNYTFVASMEKNNKIALIDTDDTGSTLYMIDLKEKARTNILTYPFIKDLKWLPGTEDFIFEGRAEGESSDSIYLYSASQKKAQKLELKTSIKNVVPVNQNELVAATIQKVTGDVAQPEGKLVVLGENESTPNALTSSSFPSTTEQVLKFVDYSLVANQSRLLKTAPDLAFPQQGKLSATGKSAYFTIDGKDYELTFTD
jgi:hypothetical protein